MDPFVSPWPSPRDLDDMPNDTLQMDMITDLHEQFEPQTRARSNTWPLPRPENFVEPPDDSGSTKCSNQQLAQCGTGSQTPSSPGLSGTPVSAAAAAAAAAAAHKKGNTSRRNAWGNLSYADLITQAISSASDNRLTLSQIYEWMVQNVPYFKDKGDSNSSAGWKNSIRHNLSLHNRFMRVQNEGTGKSSWWMLNPDAKPGKSVRRRAASMETSKYEKRRGRAKKRVEAMRSAGLSGISGINDVSPSPSSSVSEGLDLFPDSPLHSGFQLSPDFRQRASSNASSIGRYSPIPDMVGVEPDWGYANATGVTAAALAAQQTDYAPQSTDTPGGLAQATALDQLAGSLADDLSLQKEFMQGFSNASAMHTQPPPPYHPPQQQPQQQYSMQPMQQPLQQSYGLQTPPNRPAAGSSPMCALHRRQPCACAMSSRESMSPSSSAASAATGMSPSYPHSEPSPDPMGSFATIHLGSNGTGPGVRITTRPGNGSPTDLLTGGNNNNNTITVNSNNAQRDFLTLLNNTDIDDLDLSEFDNMPSTLMGQFMEALNSQTNLDDLALNIEGFQGGLECNVDEVIQQELNIDGLLDINIPISNHQAQPSSSSNTPTNSSSSLGSSHSPSSGSQNALSSSSSGLPNGHPLQANGSLLASMQSHTLHDLVASNGGHPQQQQLHHQHMQPLPAATTLSLGAAVAASASSVSAPANAGQYSTAQATPPSWVH